MPFTQAQILASQLAIANARENNPKNIANPIVVSTTPESNVMPNGMTISWVNPNPLSTLPEATITNESTIKGTSVIVEPNIETSTNGKITTGGKAILSDTLKKPKNLLYGLRVLLAVYIAYKLVKK